MKPPPLPKFNVRTIMFSCRMHFHGDSGWEVVDITCPSHVLWMMHYQGIRKCEKEAPNKMVKTKLFIDIALLKFNMLTTLCVKWWPVWLSFEEKSCLSTAVSLLSSFLVPSNLGSSPVSVNVPWQTFRETNGPPSILYAHDMYMACPTPLFSLNRN